MEPARLEPGHAPSEAAVRTVSRESLESWLHSASLGDESAFARVYDAVAPRVFGLVQLILGDAHQSEEVTGEVFLQVWETSSRFDLARGSALSWILGLAHRRAVARVRSTGAEHASREGTMGRRESLSATQRRALELTYFGGHTDVEVSALMNLSLGTARTRIRDGLIRLRDEPERDPGQPTRAVR